MGKQDFFFSSVLEFNQEPNIFYKNNLSCQREQFTFIHDLQEHTADKLFL